MEILSKAKNKILDFWGKHKILSGIILIILLGLIFILRPKPPKPVSLDTVTRGDLVQSVSITGSVNAENTVNLSFLTGGKLVYFGAKKGDNVMQYQTIAVLDQRSVQINLQNALIDYSKQRNIFDQTQQLGQNGGLQAQQKMSLEQTGAQAKLGQGPDEANFINDMVKRVLENNQGDLNKAVNSVELQSVARDQAVLTTPIAGILTRADAQNTGINIPSTATWTVVDPNSLYFKMEVDEADIASINVGDSVEVNLDPYPNTTLKLKVDSIDFVTHTTSTGGNAYDVKAKMPENSDYHWRVGMNGNAQIMTKIKKGVLKIPLSSIENDNEVLVKRGNKFELRKIKVGLENDISAEVKSGLAENEKVASDPTSVAKNQILKASK